MSDSDNEDAKEIDKEQLHRLEQNDIKTDKKAKRKKRLENQGIKDDESGSEASLEKDSEDEDSDD
jgi:hypothetical protein